MTAFTVLCAAISKKHAVVEAEVDDRHFNQETSKEEMPNGVMSASDSAAGADSASKSAYGAPRNIGKSAPSAKPSYDGHDSLDESSLNGQHSDSAERREHPTATVPELDNMEAADHAERGMSGISHRDTQSGQVSVCRRPPKYMPYAPANLPSNSMPSTIHGTKAIRLPPPSIVPSYQVRM